MLPPAKLGRAGWLIPVVLSLPLVGCATELPTEAELFVMAGIQNEQMKLPPKDKDRIVSEQKISLRNQRS